MPRICAQAYALATNSTDASKKDYCETFGKCTRVKDVVRRISEAACPNTSTTPVDQLSRENAQTIVSYKPLKLICNLSNSALSEPGVSCLKSAVKDEMSDHKLIIFACVGGFFGLVGGILSSFSLATFLGHQTGRMLLWWERDRMQTGGREQNRFHRPPALLKIIRSALVGAAVGSTQSLVQAAIGGGLLEAARLPDISMGDSLAQASLGGAVVGGMVGGLSGIYVSFPYASPVLEDAVGNTFNATFWGGVASTMTAGPLGSALQSLWKSDNQGALAAFAAQTFGSAVLGIPAIVACSLWFDTTGWPNN